MKSPLTQAEERLTELLAERKSLVRSAEKSGRRNLDDVESVEFRAISAQIQEQRELVAELKENEKRRADLSSTADRIWRAATDGGHGVENADHQIDGLTQRQRSGLQSIRESATYSKHNSVGPNAVSFFRDMIAVKCGEDLDGEAAERLRRHKAEMRSAGFEQRDVTGLNTTVGTGGSATPPAFLMEQYIRFARAGRPTANLLVQEPIPGPTTSINIPKIGGVNTGGTAVAAQSAPNVSIEAQDLSDSYVTVPVCTYAGSQVLARQLLELSPIAFDQVVFADLFAALAAKVDNAVLNDAGSSGTITGLLHTSGVNTFAAGGSSLADIYGAIASVANSIATTRYLPPNAIVTTPAIWYHIASQLDADNRPVVVPRENGAFNALGVYDAATAQGPVATIMALPVILDSQVPAGTIIVGKFDDAILFSSGAQAMVHQDRYADSLSVLLNVWSYNALAVRYSQSFWQITGVTPTTYGS